jgi:protein-disulfide isomerase
MSDKTKPANTALSVATLGLAAVAIALSAYNTIQINQLPTAAVLDEKIAQADTKFTAQLIEAQKELDAGFEKRVEDALESIVARRQADKEKSQREARASLNISSEGMLSMNANGQVVYGNPDAEVTIYTFEDFRCTFCERYHPTLQQFVNDANGQVNWIYKPYPVLGQASVQLAAAGECVAQIEGADAFWRFSEQAYATKNWVTAVKYSELQDPEKIAACVKDNTYAERIEKSLSEGREMNVTGTPASLFRNNKTEKGALIPGFIQADQIARMVQEVTGD